MCNSQYNELVLQQVDSQRSIYSSIHNSVHKSIDQPFHLTFHLSITLLIITVRRHVFVFRLFYTYLSPRIVTGSKPLLTRSICSMLALYAHISFTIQILRPSGRAPSVSIEIASVSSSEPKTVGTCTLDV
ncbi:hypothetical protein K402DRAFT_98851 [Aulographum hederae CBS 113979]|uniref:Uncharacterized protein n=1 Tax=Aulographum hederae CBS 113979 TaxID=1176131 RepID=A0A6G1GZ66_9PEZI|nr:hypothetical protein K402DRAFT_98851 [Aulographum hederae CBS 113979]